MKDQLFLLKPGFFSDGRGPLYCGDSVSVEGVLSFFPDLRTKIDVHYIDAPRPRAAVVALVGAENQSIPVLVLAGGTSPRDGSIATKAAGQSRFINSEQDIRKYLSTQYGVAVASE